jgi:uncharacterized membrane protein YgcG
MRKKALLTLVPIAGLLLATLASGDTTHRTLRINPEPEHGTVRAFVESNMVINCKRGMEGAVCTAEIAENLTVRLEAIPDDNYEFAGWGDGCSHCGTGLTCTVITYHDTTCSATFRASGGGTGGGTGGGGTGGGGGGGCSMTGSSSASLWNILVWLSVPFFALARRIRRK